MCMCVCVLRECFGRSCSEYSLALTDQQEILIYIANQNDHSHDENDHQGYLIYDGREQM